MSRSSRWLAAVLLTTVGTVAAANLSVACGPVSGARYEFCKQHTAAWARKTGHTVTFFSTPASTTDTLALYRQIFAARSGDIDVLMIDVVWPGLLKDHLVDLRPYSHGVEAQHFPAIVANNTVDGKLLGMPWYADAGLLYYRRDLLEKYGLPVPDTWTQLAAQSRQVQAAERHAGHADFQGFVFQGKAYEGLTCNALEWLASFGGGTVIDGDGAITLANPAAALALDTAASWIGTISPRGVLNYAEEDARGVFQNGGALFMRNWSYAWKLMQAPDSPVRNKVGIALLPRGEAGGSHAATLGGRQLAVSRYSRNPALAADLVLFMTSEALQRDQSLNGSFLPTRGKLYEDAAILASNPYMPVLYQAFAVAQARPSSVTGLRYPAVSNAFWDATHDVLTGRATAQASLDKAAGKLRQARRAAW